MILWFELTRSVRLWSFLGNVSALCWVVLCSMAGALSHALTETRWARPASASASQPRSLSACAGARRLPKPCHTWVQKIKEPRGAYNHTAAARAKLPSLLHFLYFSAHVFPRLTTNPPFMCIIGSPRLAGVTALETLGRVLPHRVLDSSRCSKRWSLSLCLFVSVCLFLLNCEKPHSRGGEEASSAIALGAKP